MSDLGTLFAAFATAWALTCGYVWHIGRRNAELQVRLEALESRAGGADQDAGDAAES